MTIDASIPDVNEYCSELLPKTGEGKGASSLVLAADIYHVYKHGRVVADLFANKRDRFTEDFMNKVIAGGLSLRTLSRDREEFLDNIRKRLKSVDSVRDTTYRKRKCEIFELSTQRTCDSARERHIPQAC